MVSASGPEAAFTVVARDKALKLIETLSAKLATATARFGQLASIALRATAVLQGMALVLPFVAGLISTLIAGATIPNMISFAIASRRARIQLQFMGLDATNARAAVESFSAALDRSTATSLLQNADAIAGVAVAGADLAIGLGLLAKELATITGLDVTEVFNALIQARLFDNVEPLLRLVGALNALGISLGDLEGLTGGQIIDLLRKLLSPETVTNAEGLAAAMERLSEVTLPTREAISELVIAFLLVLIASLEERIRILQDDFGQVVLGALTGAMLGAGRGLGGILAGAVLGALGTVLILDFANTLKTAFQNPLLVASILAIAATVGSVTGKGFIVALVLAAAVGLLPGLKEQFDKLSEADKIGVVILTAATAFGVAFGIKFIQALALGEILRQAALAIAVGDESDKTKLAFGVAGAAIGAFFGRSLIGGIIGFFAAQTLFELIKDTGWFANIELVANVVIFVFKTAKAAAFRLFDGLEFVIKLVLGGIINSFITDVNRVINLLNRVGFRISPVPLLPDPEFTPTIPFPTFPTRRVLSPKEQELDFNFPVPEGLIPRGREAPEIITINLILDRKVIATVAVDAVRREFKFKSGIVSGFAI